MAATKLDMKRAIQIRRLFAGGRTADQLRADFGLSQASVYSITRSDAYKPEVTIKLTDEIIADWISRAEQAGQTLEDFASQQVMSRLG